MKTKGRVVPFAAVLMILQGSLVAAQVSSPPIAAQPGEAGVNPQDKGTIHDPAAPASSNRGDPGTEPLNPAVGGPAMGQGSRVLESPPARVTAPGEIPGPGQPANE